MKKITVELDEAERNRVVNALTALALQQERAANGHKMTGPSWKDIRAVIRQDARDCRLLAGKIRELKGTEDGDAG